MSGCTKANVDADERIDSMHLQGVTVEPRDHLNKKRLLTLDTLLFFAIFTHSQSLLTDLSAGLCI